MAYISPYDVLQKETKEIKHFYQLTMWSYENVDLDVSGKHIVKSALDGTISPNIEGENIRLFCNRGHLKAHLKSKLGRELRALLFVRLISALEVFLIDAVKYAFLQAPFLLSTNKKKLETSYSELIATRSITDLEWSIAEKETRKLHSGGFQEIVKFYNSQLKINMSSLGISLSSIERSHDRRHLLVHRLGKTDSIYRHKYNEKSMKIKIDSIELLELIRLIEDLSLKVDRALESRVAEVQQEDRVEYPAVEIVFRVVESFPEVLQSDFCFVLKDRYIRNSDLYTLTHKTNGSYKVLTHCSYDDIILVNRKIRRLAKAGLLEIINVKAESPLPDALCPVVESELEEIIKLLPKRKDWNKDIHKQLAKYIGISNGKASKITSYISGSPKLCKKLGSNLLQVKILD